MSTDARRDAPSEQVQKVVVAAQSASVTLRAGGSVLTLMATRKADGTATTAVTTRDAEKNTSRGMTEQHKTFEAAKAHINVLAEKAQKLGWQRGTFKVVARPDAFSKLPPVPKAVIY